MNSELVVRSALRAVNYDLKSSRDGERERERECSLWPDGLHNAAPGSSRCVFVSVVPRVCVCVCVCVLVCACVGV